MEAELTREPLVKIKHFYACILLRMSSRVWQYYVNHNNPAGVWYLLFKRVGLHTHGRPNNYLTLSLLNCVVLNLLLLFSSNLYSICFDCFIFLLYKNSFERVSLIVTSFCEIHQVCSLIRNFTCGAWNAFGWFTENTPGLQSLFTKHSGSDKTLHHCHAVFV